MTNRFSIVIELTSLSDMFVKIQSEKESTMTRNTRSKKTIQEKKNKDPNDGVFTDTSGHVYDTLYLD